MNSLSNLYRSCLNGSQGLTSQRLLVVLSPSLNWWQVFSWLLTPNFRYPLSVMVFVFLFFRRMLLGVVWLGILLLLWFPLLLKLLSISFESTPSQSLGLFRLGQKLAFWEVSEVFTWVGPEICLWLLMIILFLGPLRGQSAGLVISHALGVRGSVQLVTTSRLNMATRSRPSNRGCVRIKYYYRLLSTAKKKHFRKRKKTKNTKRLPNRCPPSPWRSSLGRARLHHGAPRRSTGSGARALKHQNHQARNLKIPLKKNIIKHRNPMGIFTHGKIIIIWFPVLNLLGLWGLFFNPRGFEAFLQTKNNYRKKHEAHPAKGPLATAAWSHQNHPKNRPTAYTQHDQSSRKKKKRSTSLVAKPGLDWL